MKKPSLLVVKTKVALDPKFKRHKGYIDLSVASREEKRFIRIYRSYFNANLFPIEIQDKTESRTKMTTTISMYLVEFGGQDVISFMESLESEFNVVEG